MIQEIKITSALLEGENVTPVTRPRQELELLNCLPKEIILKILTDANLETPEALKTRKTCVLFNHLIGEILSEKGEVQVQFDQFNKTLERIKPQVGLLGGRKITVIRSASVSATSTAANLVEAKKISAKLKSFDLYLAYLAQHALPRVLNDKKVIEKKEKILASLLELKSKTATALISITETLSFINSPTVQKTEQIASRFFGFRN